MEELIEELIMDYKADKITWHDIQDIVEGRLIILAGGGKAYEKIPIRERIAEENAILEAIESAIIEEVE